MPSMMTAPEVLDQYFLETRCKIIEIAATLDRLDRAPGTGAITDDPRFAQLQTALRLLTESSPDRAGRCQMTFSLPHDDRAPQPIES